MQNKSNFISGLIIKSKTPEGDLAKQTFIAAEYKGEIIYLIRKRILSSHRHRLAGGKVIKKFKDKYLIEYHYSIKQETLFTVVRWATEYAQCGKFCKINLNK